MMSFETRWNNSILQLPGNHILQTASWGKIKTRYGWNPTYYVWQEKGKSISKRSVAPDSIFPNENICAAALLLARKIKLLGFSLNILYVPKGPMLDWQDEDLRRKVLTDLVEEAKTRGAIFLKIDPEVYMGTGIPGEINWTDNPVGLSLKAELQQSGWLYSSEQIQFQNTVMIHLEKPEAELLSAMKQKTRYNVRLAERKGVSVRVGSLADLQSLYHMYAETSIRDGFVIRSQEYYQAVWGEFIQQGLAEVLIAEAEGVMIAGLLLFIFGERAWYLYGMSSQAQREKMPNYLLQWEAIKLAKLRGCKVYDLWGAPTTFSETDPLWGVFRFKEGLGGEVVRGLGAWDLPLKPRFYRLYTHSLPQILKFMRRRGQNQTRQQLGA